MSTGVYTHVPFCVQKCAYCDFLSFGCDVNGGDEVFEKYVDALLTEIKSVGNCREIIDTVYFGGGTPTVLPSPLLCKILQAIKQFPLTSDAEITVESNPGTLTPEYLAALKAAGVTRLSMGLQSTHLHLLQVLGRMHSKDDLIENFHAARHAGFENINIDLMFGLPGQTPEQWRETLREVIALAPEHISAYGLTPAEDTPLWNQLESGQVCLLDDEIERDMYHTARRMLTDAGFSHYEISNFAKPGFESRHNINCWTMKPYRGFGLGAHSFDGAARWRNTHGMAEYLCQNFTNESYKHDIQHLTTADIMAETMILGLRLTQGVSQQAFAEVFGVTPAQQYPDEINQLIAADLLDVNGDNLALTTKGLDFANRVFAAFV